MPKLRIAMATYAYQIAIAADQMFNAALGGYADETLSSRIYRNNQFCRKPLLRWKLAMKTVNGMFFWQKNHCQKSYESEQVRKHMDKHFREGGQCTAGSN